VLTRETVYNYFTQKLLSGWQLFQLAVVLVGNYVVGRCLFGNCLVVSCLVSSGLVAWQLPGWQ